jgi:hypothetical protein
MLANVVYLNCILNRINGYPSLEAAATLLSRLSIYFLSQPNRLTFSVALEFPHDAVILPMVKKFLIMSTQRQWLGSGDQPLFLMSKAAPAFGAARLLFRVVCNPCDRPAER